MSEIEWKGCTLLNGICCFSVAGCFAIHNRSWKKKKTIEVKEDGKETVGSYHVTELKSRSKKNDTRKKKMKRVLLSPIPLHHLNWTLQLIKGPNKRGCFTSRQHHRHYRRTYWSSLVAWQPNSSHVTRNPINTNRRCMYTLIRIFKYRSHSH